MTDGCYLCKNKGCDDCFESNANIMKPIFPKNEKRNKNVV